MHTKNYLNAEKLWFVTSRSSKGQKVSTHSSLEMAEKAKDNLIKLSGLDPAEIHIYEGDKMP